MPPLAFQVHVRARVGSTNDEVRAMAAAGAGHGTVVRAAEQVSGRGQRGRRWSSPPGNVYMSVLLQVPHAVRRAAEIGFVAGLAVADAVDAVLPPGRRAAVKWPNDVLVGGGKIAGVLTELLDGGAAVVGVGLNVAHAPGDLPYPATSLHAQGAGAATAAGVADGVLDALAVRWAEWVAGGFGPIRDGWRSRGPAPGTELLVGLPGGAVAGSFEDLDGDGALVLHVGGAARRFVVGEVLP